MITIKNIIGGTSLAVQWLRLCISNAGGMGSIPGQGTKIPNSAGCSPSSPEKNIRYLFPGVDYKAP